MSKNNIETDVRIALDNASFENISEIMEDIDPAEFVVPKEISLSRIKKNAMSKINKKEKKKISIFKLASGIVAAAAIIFGLTITFSEDARAAVFGMFSFVPGVGFVESEPSINNTEAANDSNDQVFDTNIYTLGNPDEKVSNDDIDIKLVNLMVKDGKMDIEYFAELKKIELEDLNNIFEKYEAFTDEEYLQFFADMYISYGYDKYFEINNKIIDQFDAVKEPHSSIKIDGKEIKPVKSGTFFSEVAACRNADVKETYDVSQLNITEDAECILTVGDMEIPIKFENVKAYAEKEEAAGNRVIAANNDGIELVYDAKWDDGDLYVDIYPVSTGDYSDILNYSVMAWADGEYIEGWPNENYMIDEENPATHYVFDASKHSKDSKYTFKVLNITAKKSMDAEVSLEIDNPEYGIYEVDKQYVVNDDKLSLEKYKIMDMNTASIAWNFGIDEYVYALKGDCIGLRINNESDRLGTEINPENAVNHRLICFTKIKINGTDEEVAEVWADDNDAYEIFLGKDISKIKSLQFTEPIYTVFVNLEKELVVK